MTNGYSTEVCEACGLVMEEECSDCGEIHCGYCDGPVCGDCYMGTNEGAPQSASDTRDKHSEEL